MQKRRRSPLRGRKQTIEHRRNGAMSRIGNKNAEGCKHSEESKVNQRIAVTGNKYSLGKKNAEGCKHSAASNQKTSLAMMGNKNGEGHEVSEEVRQKIRVALTGHLVSKEVRQKIREKNVNYQPSEENIKKISGENSKWWRGGCPRIYTSCWRTVAKAIRLRDNGLCILCGGFERNRKSAVHHIDCHKDNNDPLNLATVCSRCHGKIHATVDSEQDYEIILSNWIRQKFGFKTVNIIGGKTAGGKENGKHSGFRR